MPGPNETVANHVVSRISTAGLEVFSSKGGDVIADLVGYYKGSGGGVTKPVPPDPAPPAIPPPYWMIAPSISRMNSGRSVAAGADSAATVNTGKIWHWTGTGYVGNNSQNIATFGHRTDYGGPLYFVDDLKGGDRIYVSTTDQRTYVYKYNRRDLTSSSNAQILAATQTIERRVDVTHRLHRRLRPIEVRVSGCMGGHQPRVPDHRDVRTRVLDRRHPTAVSRVWVDSLTRLAGLAQLVEHLTCNHVVASSTLAPGSNKTPAYRPDRARAPVSELAPCPRIAHVPL